MGAVMNLAVNGTLMRGLELNTNMLEAKATFLRDAMTAPAYRLWSINDRHPAMIRVVSGGVSIALEIWAVSPEGLAQILMQEPPGLCKSRIECSVVDRQDRRAARFLGGIGDVQGMHSSPTDEELHALIPN